MNKDLTVNEVSAILKVAPPTIYRLINGGQLEMYKIGRSTRIKAESLARFRGIPEDVNHLIKKLGDNAAGFDLPEIKELIALTREIIRLQAGRMSTVQYEWLVKHFTQQGIKLMGSPHLYDTEYLRSDDFLDDIDKIRRTVIAGLESQ